MSAVAAKAVSWTETGYVPDSVIRAGIRRLLESKRSEIHAGDIEYAAHAVNDFVTMMKQSPVALVPELANEQHYEVPAGFFREVMGEHLKYSCGFWPEGVRTLTEAEQAALATTCERAGIEDGMRVLDLGCGWGSLSLWIAEHYPRCRVVSVSNSGSQQAFIKARAAERELDNIDVHVCDMNDFEAPGRFQRIVSVEMFEHMRNYAELFRRIDSWLEPEGRFFMHIFCHHSTPYEFVDRGPTDWMSRFFFSGGIMPSSDLPLRFPDHLAIDKTWRWNGKHYARTCNAWLEQMDSRRETIMPIFAECYGADQASLWWQRWRIFFMACAELFDYRGGNEWYVGHYLFRKVGE